MGIIAPVSDLDHTVLLADAHLPTRAGVRSVLEAAGMTVVADVGTAGEAIETAVRLRPELALLDVSVPGGGIHAAEQICARAPQTAVIMLAAAADDEQLFEALRVGARGYLLKDTDPDRLPLALAGVLKGEAAVPRPLVARLIEEFRRRDRRRRAPALQVDGEPLTEREWEVLELMHSGLATRQIAERLEISQVTVRRHVSAALHKLRVKDRAEAIALLDEASG